MWKRHLQLVQLVADSFLEVTDVKNCRIAPQLVVLRCALLPKRMLRLQNRDDTNAIKLWLGWCVLLSSPENAKEFGVQPELLTISTVYEKFQFLSALLLMSSFTKVVGGASCAVKVSFYYSDGKNVLGMRAAP